jgi:hypothetical protein
MLSKKSHLLRAERNHEHRDDHEYTPTHPNKFRFGGHGSNWTGNQEHVMPEKSKLLSSDSTNKSGSKIERSRTCLLENEQQRQRSSRGGGENPSTRGGRQPSTSSTRATLYRAGPLAPIRRHPARTKNGALENQRREIPGETRADETEVHKKRIFSGNTVR